MTRTNAHDRMAGKVAIVTGAGGGIGSALAELFCQHGARVLLVEQDAEALDRAVAAIADRVPDVALAACAADVSRADDAARAVEQAIAAFGALDVLVNNAGVRNLDA